MILSGEGGGEMGWRAPLLPVNPIIALEKQAVTPSWQQAARKKQCDAVYRRKESFSPVTSLVGGRTLSSLCSSNEASQQ